MMALRLRVPVVPVHLQGLFDVLPAHRTWPRPGRAHVRFGAPVDLKGTLVYEEAARRVERAVKECSLGSASKFNNVIGVELGTGDRA